MIRAWPLARAAAIVAALGVVSALFLGCKKDKSVGEEVQEASKLCFVGASTMFELRAAMGDYPREEADRRTAQSDQELRASCRAESSRDDCCAAVKRLKERLAGQKVANCDDFFQRVAALGCS